MISDAHAHFFACGWNGGPDIDDYERVRAEYGIDRVLAVGYEGLPRYAGNNAHLARLAADRPWLTPLAYLDAGPRQDWESLQRQGFRGISLYCTDHQDAGAALDELRRPLNAAAALISVNCPAYRIGALAGALRELPDTSVLISHLGLPGSLPAGDRGRARDRLAGLLELARLPAVGVKLSGGYAAGEGAAECAGILLDAFGVERLYWGSDFAPCLDAGPFELARHAFDSLPLTAAERRQVEHRNLVRVLELADAGHLAHHQQSGSSR